jgi:hypothetical protein
MWTLTVIVGAGLFGFGMYLWGTITGQARAADRLADEWHDGFREGWNACADLDADMTIIWGGSR